MYSTVNQPDMELTKTVSAREADRHKLDMQVNEFLRNGGSIQNLDGVKVEPKIYFADPKSKISENNRLSAQRHKHKNILNREAALEAGRRTFIGQRCHACGGYERWTKGAGCVNCKNEKPISPKTEAMQCRKLAAQKLQSTYTGQACKHCGGTERNTETGYCVNLHGRKHS